MWSGVYLRSNLSDTLLQKVLALVPLTATGPKVFVATMNKFLSDYYDYLEETLTHMNILKLTSYPGENITDCCAAILVDAEHFYHLGYINHICEDYYDSRFRLRDIHKYKEFTDFIKKLCVCDIYAISQEELITYESLVQEAVQ